MSKSAFKQGGKQNIKGDVDRLGFILMYACHSDLSGNNLTALSPSAFDTLTKLKQL